MTGTRLLTTKHVARLAHFTLACGKRLEDVEIGYEIYGEVAPTADNVVLVCHFFSGSSHAAGKYTPDDAVVGWWDAVIGPGKAIDTERFCVIAIDALGNMRVDAPHTVTTSPSTVNPSTGHVYGPDFPELAIADMVATQRLVLDQLGVTRLAAVVGPSLGAMQALEWAVSRPQEVDRVVAAIGMTQMLPREHGLYCAMEDAIRLDPAFKDGRYAREAPPRAGLAIAIKLMMTLSSGHNLPGAPDHADVQAFDAWLDREARTRASLCDANAMISLLHSNTRWRLGGLPLAEAVARITARVLLLPSEDDFLLPAATYNAPLAQALAACGADVRVETLPAGFGHLGGLVNIAHAAGAIKACLEAPVRV